MAVPNSAEITVPLSERRHGEQARVVGPFPRSLPSPKEEKLILDDGSAQCAAVDVMQTERTSAPVIKEIAGLQVSVIPEREGYTVQRVGARLGSDRYGGSAGHSLLGVKNCRS